MLVQRMSCHDLVNVRSVYGTTLGGVIDTSTGFAYFTFATPLALGGLPMGWGHIVKYQVAGMS